MILDKMLDRLYRSLVSGPCLNARPHKSRQRIDLTAIEAFSSRNPQEVLNALLGEKSQSEVPAKVPVFYPPELEKEKWTPSQKDAERKSKAQENLLNKLGEIAEDAHDYEHDHGESALSIGFPILNIPPKPDRLTRIVAPLAFISISLQVRPGAKKGVTILGNAEGIDRVVPNPALLAWIRQQTGEDVMNLFADDDGSKPWDEIKSLVAAVSKALGLENPPLIDENTVLATFPKAEDMGDEPSILPCGVLGLFPLANQGLLNDTRWMIEEEKNLKAPVSTFLKPEAIGPAREESEESSFLVPTEKRTFADEHLVTYADPCQASAVMAAGSKPVVVIHGPPGSGKSQTITNIIGSHLAKGERVLFVCDKRTALDVVKYRLESTGLGHLCALIHDPKREQKDLYMGLRERIDGLVDEPLVSDPAVELGRINLQLLTIHGELTSFYQSLHHSENGQNESFHSLFGRWLELNSPESFLVETELTGQLEISEVENSVTAVEESMNRVQQVAYGENPWRRACGLNLGQFLASNPNSITKHLQHLLELARQSDEIVHEQLPVLFEGDLKVQGELRSELASLLRDAAKTCPQDLVQHLQSFSPEILPKHAATLAQNANDIESIRKVPLDTNLVLASNPDSLQANFISLSILNLETYLPLADKWYKFLMAGKVKKAKEALSPLGLTPTAENVGKALQYLAAVQARKRASATINQILGQDHGLLLGDDQILSVHDGLSVGLKVLQKSSVHPELSPLWDTVRSYLASPDYMVALADLLDLSAQKAEIISNWENEAAAQNVLAENLREQVSMAMRGNSACARYVEALSDTKLTIENVLRLEGALDSMPAAVKTQSESLAILGVSFQEAMTALRKLAISNAIRARLESDSGLHQISNEKVEALLNGYIKLQFQKRTLNVQRARYFWQNRARQRLLAGTGTQMNTLGANLKTRLLTRGARALKLRKMIEVGQTVDGGDPLYDLCPVWMSSPNTVAQIFPRLPLFDVVVFDEASQCRLEEALPVLLRAKRVVVAGDPKQLPPTRFFESGIVESQDDEIENEDDAFQVQQAETEDLLCAALNLSVHEAYLDVHYRSSNSALIEFSNKSFYKGRLQAIPAHPNSVALESPLKLHQVDGLYKDRTNETEAKEVLRIVKELLKQPNPPTIGIACFNLTQRELIRETLDNAAEEDPNFAKLLSEARNRKGKQSFEGLFVKNLENVQGDERDHIIISTTFGVNPEGKFRRGFGPLSSKNGGRRLNVLVTRSRDTIHIVTSIPRSEYASVEDTLDGSQANGRILLYQYLQYAERIEAEYKKLHTDLYEAAKKVQGKMIELTTSYPSVAVSALGGDINRELQLGGFVNWGNDGFNVDVALNHPEKPLRVTAGVLCDFTRYGKTPDPIDWEAFRYYVLADLTKWKVSRMWSPVAFRALEQARSGVKEAHNSQLVN